MDRQDAILVYLSKNLNVAKMIERIERWDEMLTTEENCKLLGISVNAGKTFKMRFGLRSDVVTPTILDHSIDPEKIKLIELMSAEGYSQRFIAGHVGVSLPTVNKYCEKNKKKT